MQKIALITGATAGFGNSSVKEFIDNGWKVIATGRREERLLALKEQFGEALHTLTFDIQNSTQINEAIDSLPSNFKNIDLLINNAGLALGTAAAQECDLEQWNTMVDTNIRGLMSLTHKVLPTLIEQRGAVINISSVAASYPYPGGNVYGGTKAFVVQFSLGLRSDLHGTGVRVTCVEPGMSETEFTLVRTKGDQSASDKLYEGANPMTGEDIAKTLYWIATLPPHMNINRVELMPVNQSFSPFQVHRN
ncbi:MAG TPA: NADP-dependent 3-hydroxy acid dehydrogenase [Betaproteobacteria bacterium]|jgi:serine 3-dehydrogenase (NADP+)|nr:SDR family NAD(P)-dependent oxidoreductase [Burkholderiales bacterium]HAT52854.1 NADP-dependent 3-hydroxy acid dehydrogenase [Betaproteobacteria bacterium]